MNKKIQIIRGIAICAVVMIHSNARGVSGIMIRALINFAVPMFIFCSGYLTKLETSNYLYFIKKRLSKVFIPYILWSIIYTTIDNNWENFYRNLLTANAIYPFYFIFVYVQFVVLTPLISKLIKSKYRWLGWLITPFSMFIIRYICYFKEIKLDFPFPATLCIVWFTYYYLGMILGNNAEGGYCFGNNKNLVTIYVLLLLVSEIESIIWWYGFRNRDMATTQIRLTSLLTSTVACLLAHSYIFNNKFKTDENNIVGRGLIKIGDCSFGIYLAHVEVMRMLGKLPFYKYLYFPLKSVVIILVTTLLVMLGQRLLGKYAKYAGL